MARPLRVGVQLPEVERHVGWPGYAAMARAAEELGFDSIWVGDHLLYRDDGRPERGPWDAWTLLAGLAVATQRVALGPLVACAAFHPPGLIARMAAALDEISDGRFVLGIGAGWNEVEFRAFGIPFDRRVGRFEEAFEVITRLLAGERVTLDGRFSRAEDAILMPPPARRVPVMIGGAGPRILAAGLPRADAWNTWYDWYGNNPEGFAARNADVSAAAQRAGRRPEEIARSACVFVALEPVTTQRHAHEETKPVEGIPSRLAAHLRELAGAGADEAILVVHPIDERSIRALGETLALLDSS